MQTFGHFTIPPYAVDPSGTGPLFTAGSFVSIPMPAGILTFFPLMKMSRCECTWYSRCSFTSGTSPALRVSAIGSFGAGHGAAPVFGTGAGWTARASEAASAVTMPPSLARIGSTTKEGKRGDDRDQSTARTTGRRRREAIRPPLVVRPGRAEPDPGRGR